MAKQKAAPAPKSEDAPKAEAGVIQIASRECEAAQARVWDVSYSWAGKDRVERGFRSEDDARAHANAIADAYGLSVA